MTNNELIFFFIHAESVFHYIKMSDSAKSLKYIRLISFFFLNSISSCTIKEGQWDIIRCWDVFRHWLIFFYILIISIKDGCEIGYFFFLNQTFKFLLIWKDYFLIRISVMKNIHLNLNLLKLFFYLGFKSDF